MKLRRILVFLVIAAVISLFYWPTFRWLVQSWLSDSYYSHGFLVPFISAFFIWTKREQLKERTPSVVGIAFLAVGVTLYILGSVLDMRLLNGLSLLVILAALSLAFLGKNVTWAIAFPLCFLIFMIPLPFVQSLGYRLQTISIDATSWILSATSLPLTFVGSEIHMGEDVFTLGLACAGTNTLIALLALVAVYAHILKGPFYKRALLFILAFPFAIVANILRVTSIILVAYYVSVDFASGVYHDYIASILFYFMAFLSIVAIGRGIGCRLVYDGSRMYSK